MLKCEVEFFKRFILIHLDTFSFVLGGVGIITDIRFGSPRTFLLSKRDAVKRCTVSALLYGTRGTNDPARCQ